MVPIMQETSPQSRAGARVAPQGTDGRETLRFQKTAEASQESGTVSLGALAIQLKGHPVAHS